MFATLATIDCAHAGPAERTSRPRCALGLFGGEPHVGQCRRCERRMSVPRLADAAPIIARTDAAAADVPPGRANAPAPGCNGNGWHPQIVGPGAGSFTETRQKLLLRCRLSP